ncbi:MAG: flagellar basal body rod protein FlgF [Proteobacteria bacterium]|nr:flagellar basal body rod protein FlgF [Pseudomonadota bacterium]
MDRVVYTANSGLKHTMDRMSTASGNLANAMTNGFRAQIDSMRSVPVTGDGLPTRNLAVNASAGSDFSQGTLHDTGNKLDVAIQGKGWIAVRGTDDKEAYTRAGSFTTDIAGMLQTQSGLKVLGDTGPITVPPNSTVLIGKDGTVSASKTGLSSNAMEALGRIKLVDPPELDLIRGDDGLFRLSSGRPATASAAVTLVSGATESSNVNPVDEMVNMVNLARQFEMHAKLLQQSETIAGKADQLLSIS